mmetsp:Transcript_60440/g.68918  ORF Transcript_60440/g.68918 Transcript_60440/m.68918 type:complete len:162 (+) Transcript_60440:351-836(+)
MAAETESRLEAFLRILAMLVGAVFIFFGFYSIFTETSSLDVKGYIRCIYNIILGVVMFVSELPRVDLKGWFGFMYRDLGKGLFYWFCAGLAFDHSEKAVQYGVQFSLGICGVGFILLSMYKTCTQKGQKTENGDDKDPLLDSEISPESVPQTTEKKSKQKA